MKKFQIYKNLLASTKYIPMDELKAGVTYRLISRNAMYGIWLPEQSGFLISRHKYGHVFLFVEYHWDSDNVHGTVKPFECIEKSPFDPLDLEVLVDDDFTVISDTTGYIYSGSMKFHNYMSSFDDETLDKLSKYQ